MTHLEQNRTLRFIDERDFGLGFDGIKWSTCLLHLFLVLVAQLESDLVGRIQCHELGPVLLRRWVRHVLVFQCK